MVKQLDAYCGLYCGACFVMKANETGRGEELASQWNLEPEDVYCNGCKSGTLFINCRGCQLRECAVARNVSFCYQCQDYPCKDFSAFTKAKPHIIEVIENLEYIKQYGRVKWLETQEKRWSCANCGEKYSWYDQVCDNCGEKLEGYEEPVKKHYSRE
ncbi:MAG: DUF3795 domain-containing protein [Candidatus Odinarchaeota archaeon]